MSPRQVSTPPLLSPNEPDERLRFGWRDIETLHPDGTITVQQIPLTEEDLLFPQEGDHIVHPIEHWDNLVYLSKSLQTLFRNIEGRVVLGDGGVEFGVPGIPSFLVPDITVLDDVVAWQRTAILDIREEGGRPVLVIEATSPSTYRNDTVSKVDLYLLGGVYKYVIYDRGPDGNQPPRLVGRVREGDRWRMMELDDKGRLDLDPLPIWLTIEDNRPWIYVKETGQRIPDYFEALDRHAEAQLTARAAEETWEAANRKSQNAEAKAREATKARELAEAKARDAEAKAQEEATGRERAEAKARKEAKARELAEAKARDAEAKARDAAMQAQNAATERALLEERLKRLEEELKRRPPT